MRNEQDIVAGSKGGLKIKFKTKYHSFSSCILCFALLFLEHQRTFVALYFVLPMTKKKLQFGVEMRKNLKVFSDKVPFVVYPNSNLVAT